MLWIKEVEMVNSVDDHESLRSVQGYSFPNIDVLDAKIVSALNEEIIKNSDSNKKVHLEG